MSSAKDCTGFSCPGFGSRVAIEVASERSCQKLPSGSTGPMPVGSRMDIPRPRPPAMVVVPLA